MSGDISKDTNGSGHQVITGMMKLSDHEFKLIRDLVYQRFGINLTEKKRSLIVGRLNSLLKKKNLKTFKDYYDYVINDKTGEALLTLVDKLSTNHTFFNRENDHFEYLLKEVIPVLTELPWIRERKEIKIWVAGCSSGEEPYMLAMLLHDHFKKIKEKWTVKILASDISTKVLKKANSGLYLENDISKLPKNLLMKHMKKQSDGQWLINKEIMDMVLYKRLNLIRESYPFKNKFHVVFCRNVMIYFDNVTRRKLVANFSKYMFSGSFLFIGHSETIGREGHSFSYLQPAVYRKD